MARAWQLGRGAGDARARRRGRRRGPRASPTSSACRTDGYRLSDAQAQAILEMRLQRLTGLEQDKIVDEYQRGDGADRRPARHPRAARARCSTIIRDELDRRSARRSATSAAARSSQDHRDLTIEDLIAPEDMVVTLSHARLHQGQPVDGLPRAEARRPRQGRRRRRRKTISSTSCSSRTRTTPAVLLQPRPGVLAQGLPGAAGEPRLARQADRQHVPARRRARGSRRCCRSRSSTRTSSCSWRPRRAR